MSVKRAFESESGSSDEYGRARSRRGGAALKEIFVPRHLPMTRDDVLSMSTAEFDAFLVKHDLLVTHSPEANSEALRIRRLISNRESSVRSRTSRKQHIATLEERCAQLERANAELAEQNKLLHIKVYFAEGGVFL